MLHGVVFWAWRAFSALVRLVPTRVAYPVAAAGGDLFYMGWRNKREIAKHNFSAVLARPAGDREVARLARRSFRNFGRYMVDTMRLPAMSFADLARVVHLPAETWTNLNTAREGGRGLLLVSIHYGNFEFGGARIAEAFPVNVVADQLENSRLMDLLVLNRAQKNVAILRPEGAAKAVLRALRRNEIVGLMVDLGPRALDFPNATAEFFGRPTVFPTAAADLARVSGAPIVVAAVSREADGTFLGVALAPFFVERTAEAAHDVQRAVQEIARRLEPFVRQHPEQWYIYRPMWPMARV